MLERNRSRLICNLSGAVLAGLTVAMVFTTFGYSGGATLGDFAGEFMLAIVSFGCAALFWYYASARNSLLLNAIAVCLLGALLNSVLKVAILEGANGLPAYVREARELHSLQPILDLAIHCLSVTMLVSIISLAPFTLGAWLYRSKKQLLF